MRPARMSVRGWRAYRCSPSISLKAAVVDADGDRGIAVARNADYGYVAEERCV